MIASDYRAEARRKLVGKWGKAISILLASMLIIFAISFVSGIFPKKLSSIISIATLVVEMPLAFGLTIAFIKLYNDEDVKAFDFLSLGFNNFSKSWGIAFQTLLKLIIPVIIIVVSYVLIIGGTVGTATSSLISTPSFNYSYNVTAKMGTVAIIGFILYIVGFIWFSIESYYYKIAYLIAAENPELTSKEVVQKSKELMTNRRWRLFCLEFSFIGWAFLAVLTFGIGMLWLVPYMQFATIAFYKDALPKTSAKSEEVIAEENPTKE